ncbi:hypothetical protein BHM03_00031317, partial [Ensete ventricosum]
SQQLLIIPPYDHVPHGTSPVFASNYSTMIRCTISSPGDISIAFRFLCDELGLRYLHVWPLPAHHRASATSDCVRFFDNSLSPTHSWVTLGRSIALGQSIA